MLVCGSLAAPGAPPALASATPSDVALQVSFEQSASVRVRGQRVVARNRAAGARIDAVLARHDIERIERVFETPQASLDAARGRLVAAGKRDVPDLNRHYRIVTADRAERDRLLAALRSLDGVDAVIPEPEPVPPPVTPDFTARQRYTLPAPAGINTTAIAATAGGLGQNVKIIDIEYSWNEDHEDLAAANGALIPNGTPDDPFDDTNHGTAVLGELIATVDGLGVSGLAPGSDIGMVNANTTDAYAVPEAVEIARQSLAPGDVILVEQQYPVTPGDDDFVASEYWPAVYDAVKLATQSGIIVVEAAGNGGVNLDDLDEPFPLGQADSGAILVGAGSGEPGNPCAGTPNARLSFSTFGERVDLQGWGQCVMTTGYGSWWNADGPNSFYRATFNGTSSAAPIVAAAAALYSSVFQETTGGRAPAPQAVRKRLVDTGTPQAALPAGHIGPLPNVLAATTGFDFTPPTASVAAGPDGLTNDATPTFSLSASESGSTFECRFDSEPFTTCTTPYTRAVALAQGAHSFEVRATDAALNPGVATARAITVDSIAPVTSITGGPSGSLSGPSPTFTFDAGEAGVTYGCRAGPALAPGTFTSCASPHTTAALPDGASVFDVRATDPAGNVGPAARRTFTIDTIAPTVTISGPAGPTNDATPTFSFTASEPVSTLQCRVDSGPFAGCTTPYTVALALPDGAHAFEAKATDVALNAGVATVRAFTVDTVVPAVTITGGPVDTTTSATPEFTFTSADAGATFACRAGTAPLTGGFDACVSPHTTASLADGANAFEVRATDAAGNTGPAAARAFAVAVTRAQEPPPAPQPPPAPPPPPPTASAALLPPTIGPGSRLTVRVPATGVVRLARPRITCPSAGARCAVTATATRSAPGSPRIASARSTIAPGRTATLRFTLTRSARAALRRSGRLKGRVRITAAQSGRTSRRTIQLTLVRA